MPRRFDASRAKARGFDAADWDAVDNPELGSDALATAQPFEKALPKLAKTLRRGRPPSARKKTHVSLRLDPDILAALKADGRGWQTRANALLRAALGL